MRLKRLNIERYGPLNRLYLRLEKGVQPIFGENEAGKTLCVDALLKMLTGKGGEWDSCIDRVEETPEGFVVLEDNGNEFKLEKGETLADHLTIDARELRNIFVIRDADLSIPEEDVFYERVTDRITGLRSEDIRRIVEKLIERGRLTRERKEISDSSACDKAASNLADARRLQKEIREYVEKAEESGIPELEAEIFEAESHRTLLSAEIELQKKAEEKNNFLKLEKKFEESNTVLEILKKLPVGQEVTSLSARLTELKEEEKDRSLFDEVRATTRKLSFFALPSVVAGWIVSLVLGFTELQEFVIPLILLAVFGILLIGWFWASRKLSTFENRRLDLVAECRNVGVAGISISELTKGLDKLRDKRSKLTASLDQNIGVLRDTLNIDEIPREEVLKKASESLLAKKTTIDLEVSIEFNEKKMKKAEEERTEIGGRLEDLRQTLLKHNEVMKGFSKRARKLDFRTFMNKELELELENLESMKILDRELQNFVEQIESDAYLCRKAAEIFEELEGEEEAKISVLFGEDSATSQIFRDVTGKRYHAVRYNHEDKTIVVMRPSGQSLTAEKLSKGAFDQLYLSIRIDLAQRLLQGRKGFFVMDDAFLSSSPKRFKEQLKLLEKLSRIGWQIVYFTVKDEDTKLLSKISGNKTINLAPLP